MSLKAYEDACTRAELFGQPVPDREEFLEKHKHLDVVEFEEIEIKTAENTAVLDEDIKHMQGGLGDLGNILKSTQTKINKLKGVCGSLTNFFRLKASKDNLSYSTDPSYVGQTNYDKDYIPQVDNEGGCMNKSLGPNDNEMTPRAGTSKQDGDQNIGDINSGLDDLKAMQDNEQTSLLKSAFKDIGGSVTSQFSKLDQLINSAERAEDSMKHQNKQLRGFMR